MTPLRATIAILGTATLVLSLTACSPSGSDSPVREADRIRLGYFPNFTHAPAIIALENGYFGEELGDVTLEPVTFNAGPAAIEAMFGGAVDMTSLDRIPRSPGTSRAAARL